MGIIEFIKHLEKLNFSLAVENGKLILKGDKKKLTKDEISDIRKNDFVINYIKENKDKLIEYISASTKDKVFENKSKDISSIYRLSGLQEGMLFHGLYDETAGAYTQQLSCDLIKPEIEIITKSWDQVLKRHSVLRSGFYYDVFNVPVQCVYREVKLPVTVLDFRNMNGEEQSAAVRRYEEEDMGKGFDFKSVPLMRVTLLRLSEDHYRMLWTSHHILFDGWSMSIIMEEFLNIYEQFVKGKELEPAAEDLFEDYIRYIERSDKESQETYWKKYMEGIEQRTLLPFVKTTAGRTKGAGTYETLSLKLNEETSAKTESYVQKQRITTNTLMQGIWAYLLHRYTGNDEIAFGVIVSGRPDDLPGIENRVGMYINTIPLRSTMNERNGNKRVAAKFTKGSDIFTSISVYTFAGYTKMVGSQR